MISGSGGGSGEAHDGGNDASQPGSDAGSGSGGSKGPTSVDQAVVAGCGCATAGAGATSDDARRGGLITLGLALAAVLGRRRRYASQRWQFPRQPLKGRRRPGS